MRVVPSNHFNIQNLIDAREQSYIEVAKRYLEHIISIIANYAPLITFWTTLLYTIPEIEAYAIIKSSTTPATTPEPDQIDIRPIPFATQPPCPYRLVGSRATDVKICYNPPENGSACIIL